MLVGVRALLDLVAPPRCAACGARAALPWCGRCRAAAAALRLGEGCPRCAGRCDDGGCPVAGAPVVRTVAAFAYTGVVADTVVAGKVGGHHAVWRPLGGHLGAVVRRAGLPVDAVVPVPTEPTRARQRGFDHARRLAREVAHAIDRPLVAALAMRRHTPDRGRRGHGAPLPVAAIRPVSALPRTCLLVDDVMTTGATVVAAARAAAAAGAATLHVAVLARAVSAPTVRAP